MSGAATLEQFNNNNKRLKVEFHLRQVMLIFLLRVNIYVETLQISLVKVLNNESRYILSQIENL